MNSRFQIYKQFTNFVQQKDNRSMDDICRNVEGEFKLQAQQAFLKEYMRSYPLWNKLLLYHCLGSGKTCTAITMAEEYMKQFPNNKVKVILPARLRTNFIDELASPCGSPEFKKRYELYSFEKFKITAFKNADSSNMIEWIREFTRNSLIIIDEVHNLLSDSYKPDVMNRALKTGFLQKGEKGMNTILFRMLNTFADESCKFVFLTATPIFDNIYQIKILVQAIKPAVKIKSDATLKDIILHLRGKVSYFPGTSINAYPSKTYNYVNVPLSKTQDEATFKILQGENEEDSEQFMMKQRQISIACLQDGYIENMKEYCPKIEKLVRAIESKKGKHVVYCTFIKSGLHIVIKALEKQGYKAFDGVGGTGNYKTFALWDGSVKDSEKQLIKKIANSPENMDGKYIKVILGSPSIKEGVSFKHIQHVHLLDPVWNQSAKDQLEGRAIRYCSHVDIPVNHPFLKRHVIIHLYKSIPNNNGNVLQTCDEIIYDEIIVKKYETVQMGEAALKKVAIDHYLFRKMYATNAVNTPKNAGINSPISVTNMELGDKKKVRKSNTCPKKRRPINLKCPPSANGIYIRKNPQGFDCCYTKEEPAAAKPAAANGTGTSCPSSRRPDKDGKCKDGYEPRKNAKGDMCCYKKKALLKNLNAI
jgi:hypothetical protein